jgi:hypothetical protein
VPNVTVEKFFLFQNKHDLPTNQQPSLHSAQTPIAIIDGVKALKITKFIFNGFMTIKNVLC